MALTFSLGKCRTRAGYSAKLLRQGKLDLDEIKKHFPVVLETPLLLVVATAAGEVIVHGYGELLFKEGKDIAVMEKAAAKVYEYGLLHALKENRDQKRQ